MARIKGFTATFEQDFTTEEADVIINAVRMIKGIAHIDPVLNSIDDIMNNRLKWELRDKFIQFMKDNLT